MATLQQNLAALLNSGSSFNDDETPQERRARLAREAAAERVRRLQEGMGVSGEGLGSSTSLSPVDRNRVSMPSLNFGRGNDEPTQQIPTTRMRRPLVPNETLSAQASAINSRAKLQELMSDPRFAQAFNPQLNPVLVPDSGLTQAQLNTVFEDPRRSVLLPDPASTNQVNPAPLQSAIMRLANATRENARMQQEFTDERRRNIRLDNLAALGPEVFRALTQADIETGFQQRMQDNRELLRDTEEAELVARQQEALAIPEAQVQNEEIQLKVDEANNSAVFRRTLAQVQEANKAISARSRDLATLARQSVSSMLSGSGSRSGSGNFSLGGGLSQKAAGDLQKAKSTLEARLQTVDVGLSEAIKLQNNILATGFDRELNFLQRWIQNVPGEGDDRVVESLEQATGVFSQLRGTVSTLNTAFATASGMYGELGLQVPEPYIRGHEMASRLQGIINSEEDNIVKLERVAQLKEEYADLFSADGSGGRVGGPSIGTGVISPPSFEIEGVNGLGGSITGAIIPQESGGNPDAINARTGAFGLTQFNPAFAEDWIAVAGLTGQVTAEQLRNDPDAQVLVTANATERLFYEHMQDPDIGGDPLLALRRVAASWYAGRGNYDLHMSTEPEGPNGDEPSIKEYTDAIVSNWLLQQGFSQEEVASLIVDDSSVDRLNSGGMKYSQIAELYETNLTGAGGSGLDLSALNFNPSPNPIAEQAQVDDTDVDLGTSAQARADLQPQIDDVIGQLQQDLAPQTRQDPNVTPQGTGVGDELPSPQGADTPFSMDVYERNGSEVADVRIDPDAYPNQQDLQRVIEVIELELMKRFGEGNYRVSLLDPNNFIEGESPELNQLIQAIRGR